MKSYDTNETLLGDGVGIANFVYFILSGRCQMIESVQVIVTSRSGRNFYNLYDPYVSNFNRVFSFVCFFRLVFLVQLLCCLHGLRRYNKYFYSTRYLPIDFYLILIMFYLY